jgi:hypothetical protein
LGKRDFDRSVLRLSRTAVVEAPPLKPATTVEMFRSLIRVCMPRGGRPLVMAKAFLPGDATYLLGLIRDHEVRKRCFWHALAELRRLKLISEGRLPNPWKGS